MGPFDAICHSFATIATAGFSTKAGSIAEYRSLGIEVAVIVGMFLSGVNFGLFFELGGRIRKRMGERRIPRFGDLPRPRDFKEIFWNDPEWRFYSTILVLAVIAITASLWFQVDRVIPSAGFDVEHYYTTLGGSLRDAAFQTTNLVSSTGFGNSNLSGFTFFAQVLLMIIMVSGACSGSTSGGLKMVRILVVLRYLGNSMRRFIRPRSVEPLLLSASSSVVACLSNMGPGFTQLVPHSMVAGQPLGIPANAMGIDVSSYGSFGACNDPTKILLSFVMIFGRLEIYTPLIIFMPSFSMD